MEISKSTDSQGTSRREVLLGAAAIAATLATQTAFAGDEHHHKGSDTGLIDASLGCVKAGQICLDHCVELIKNGDTSISACLEAVSDMLPMCSTLSKLASSQSPHLAAFAKVCIAVCEDCEKECQKHANKHAACKACAESCAACIKACKKVAA